MSFKNKFCKEGHFDAISNRTHIIWYTKIRISNHRSRFADETIMFSKTPRDERFCLFCKKKQQKSAVEDEKHVLVHCPRFSSLRKELYNSINNLCPNFNDLRYNDKFNYLLNSDGPTVKVVARFFYLASLVHSSVSVSYIIYAMYSLFLCLSLSVCVCVCVCVCVRLSACLSVCL